MFITFYVLTMVCSLHELVPVSMVFEMLFRKVYTHDWYVLIKWLYVNVSQQGDTAKATEFQAKCRLIVDYK